MIEIQVHPSEIRGRVRYLFLGGRTAAVGLVIGTLILFELWGSMAAAPSVLRRVHRDVELRIARDSQTVQLAKLADHVTQMEGLEQKLDEQKIGIEKLLTVYGLTEEAAGKGGMAAPEPTVLLDPVTDPLVAARDKEALLRLAVSRISEQLAMLADYEAQHAELVKHVPAILPVPEEQFVLTSPFGSRISPFTRTADMHNGLDLAAPRGTPIVAAGDGVVTFAGRYPMSRSIAWWRFGNVVVINHADKFVTIYAHCDEVRVKTGQKISQGQFIATVGSSGWSTNSHLHYEVRADLDGEGVYRPVDPRIYILDHRWNDEEKLLIRSRSVREFTDYEPLPSTFVRGGRRGV